MRLRGLAFGVMLLFVLACTHSVIVAYADVPSVIGLSREEEGGDTVLVIEVRHGSPSSSHYVDAIEVEVDGKVEKTTDLEPQTSTRFKEKFVISAGAKNIRVRARCNVHGWSSWVSEEKEEPSGSKGIPGFPYVSIVLGVMTGILLLWWMNRRG